MRMLHSQLDGQMEQSAFRRVFLCCGRKSLPLFPRCFPHFHLLFNSYLWTASCCSPDSVLSFFPGAQLIYISLLSLLLGVDM